MDDRRHEDARAQRAFIEDLDPTRPEAVETVSTGRPVVLGEATRRPVPRFIDRPRTSAPSRTAGSLGRGPPMTDRSYTAIAVVAVARRFRVSGLRIREPHEDEGRLQSEVRRAGVRTTARRDGGDGAQRRVPYQTTSDPRDPFRLNGLVGAFDRHAGPPLGIHPTPASSAGTSRLRRPTILAPPHLAHARQGSVQDERPDGRVCSYRSVIGRAFSTGTSR